MSAPEKVTPPDARPTAEPPESDRQPDEKRQGARRVSRDAVFQAIAAVASLSTVAAALLVYVGWVRDYYTDAYFGLSSSLVGYGVVDTMLRSVDSVLLPVMAIGLFVLAILVARTLGLEPLFTEWYHFVRLGIAAAGVGIFITTGLGFLGAAWVQIIGPAAICVGLLFTGWGCWVRHRQPGAARERRPARAAMAVSLVLAVFAFLWSLSDYAAWYGTDTARGIQAGLASAPDVIVYSHFNLGLAGPGITHPKFPPGAAEFGYEYNGLRLLAYSNSRYFLLPSSWQPGRGSVIVLSDQTDGPLEIQFSLTDRLFP
jgi:hypothetical protein